MGELSPNHSPEIPIAPLGRKVETIIDPDGIEVTVTTYEESAAAAQAITPKESVSDGIWTLVTIKPISDLLCSVSIAVRTVPGNPLTTTAVDKDGATVTTTKTIKAGSSVVTGDVVSGGTWTRTYKEDPAVLRGFENRCGDLVVWEIVESRPFPGNILTGKSFDEFGTLETETRQMVAPGTAISQSGSSIQSLAPVDSLRSELVTKTLTVDGSGNLVSAIVTEIEHVDPKVPGSRATVYYYLVDAGSSIPDDTATTVYIRRKYEKNNSQKIEIKTVYSIPADYVEYRDMSFPFPALFTSYYSDNVQGTTRIQRSGFSANVPHKLTHTFTITPPAADGSNVPIPYPIIEQDQLLFSIPVRAIKDDTTASVTVDGVTYTQDSPASIPTKTTYEGLIGSLVTVGGSYEVWNAGIFEKITIEVKLQ